jgi:16S rRNA (guanine1516-N2)-methyltransferase
MRISCITIFLLPSVPALAFTSIPSLPSFQVSARAKTRLGNLSSFDAARHKIKFLSTQKDHLHGDLPGQRICVLSEDEGLSDAARILAETLSIPYLSEDAIDTEWFSHTLTVVRYAAGSTEGTAIGIQSFGGDSGVKKNRKGRKTPLGTPFFVDFCPPEGSKLERRTKGQSGTDLLVKAVGPGKLRSDGRNGAVIYDLTAGFGQDSLILAQNGASHVHMIERDPIVATLLQDALDRLKLISGSDDARREVACELVHRLTLQQGESALAVKCVPSDIPPPDCIYLDPMFAPRTKTAAVKKNMQILHGLLDSQDVDEVVMNDQEIELLEAALEAATSRVVVKRPIQAPPLGGLAYVSSRKASTEMKGSINRWDIYVK